MRSLSIVGAALVTLAVVASLMLTTSAGSGSGTMVVGVDADPSGNTATSLGSIDRCIEVNSGDTFDLDVFVDAIPDDQDLAGFNYLLNYDASKLQVNVCNSEMLIASEPGSYVLDLSDAVCKLSPDTDGELIVGAVDMAHVSEPGGSLGVLGRCELEAVGSGLTVLTLSPIGGGIVASSSEEFIPIDELHDGAWVPPYGIVAIDEACPGPDWTPTPTPLPTPPPSPTPTPTPTPPPGIEVIGIDVEPSGNTATSLGTIDRCIEVSSGETFDIDVFVDDIPGERDLAGFSYRLNYDPNKLKVNVCNQDMLLASEPGSEVETLSNCRPHSLPDTDGDLNTAAYDFGTAELGGSLGVLGRYQLEAGGSGISVLTLTMVTVGDSAAQGIPVDEIHDGNWTPVHGIVAIDEACPDPGWTPTPTPSPTPTPTPTSTIEIVGIDVEPNGGNTATTLGTIDRCIEVSVGQTFDIDVFVDAIPEDRDLAGFNYLLNYDASKLQVNACNNGMLLASEPDSYVVDVSEAVCRTGSPPDTDGELIVGAADLAPAPEPGGSLGVLGRYELEAVGAGTSVLTLAPIQGYVIDSSPVFIPVEEVHDGNWTPMYGIIAVDSDMDGDGASDCQDPDTDGDGFLNFREGDRGSNPLDADSTPEECDGLDNDGDTLVDDGWPDADEDGLADCVDPDMDTDGDDIANPDDPDDDNDGFTDEEEIFMGLSSLDACGSDAWAP